MGFNKSAEGKFCPLFQGTCSRVPLTGASVLPMQVVQTETASFFDLQLASSRSNSRDVLITPTLTKPAAAGDDQTLLSGV